MALETIKTTRLVGNLTIENTIVKQYTVDVDANGVSTIFENMFNAELYSKNRSEMRKQEKEFRDKRYELEDSILAELETNLEQ